MKKRFYLLLVGMLLGQIIYACPACEQQPPKITRGLVHGAGPNSQWDFVIVAIIAAITLMTLFFSLKYLIKPGEKDKDHIKQTVLSF
ncbi:MAG: hypothetical protein JST58_04520 [Bacteroidetes bacterium]|nr:hypothetical protein [Bacteroidota bacterium]